MNKRIRQLMEQAMNSSSEQGARIEDFAEIFAKLIINECIEICNDVSNSDVVDEYGDGPELCAETIEVHFGIDQ